MEVASVLEAMVIKEDVSIKYEIVTRKIASCISIQIFPQ